MYYIIYCTMESLCTMGQLAKFLFLEILILCIRMVWMALVSGLYRSMEMHLSLWTQGSLQTH
jgi:hypothetical protein